MGFFQGEHAGFGAARGCLGEHVCQDGADMRFGGQVDLAAHCRARWLSARKAAMASRRLASVCWR
jgi:hypothetical protein